MRAAPTEWAPRPVVGRTPAATDSYTRLRLARSDGLELNPNREPDPNHDAVRPSWIEPPLGNALEGSALEGLLVFGAFRAGGYSEDVDLCDLPFFVHEHAKFYRSLQAEPLDELEADHRVGCSVRRPGIGANDTGIRELDQVAGLDPRRRRRRRKGHGRGG